MKPETKREIIQKRRWRVRKKVAGTAQRPRMVARFTGKNIYVQFIDDLASKTVASASTLQKALSDDKTLKVNVAGAQRIGKLAAEAALAKGVKAVVFDRGGARYHGKVKALAEAARQVGLQF